MLWWVPLVAAGISLVGQGVSAYVQRRGAKEEEAAIEDANKLMMEQWRQNMALEMKKERRKSLENFVSRLNDDMINDVNLKNSVHKLWSRR